MAIRPVEFSGMIQNTQGVSNTRSSELQHPQSQQQNVANATAQEAALSTTQVSQSEESAKESFDTDQGGDGTGYQGNRNRNKEQKKEDNKGNHPGDGAVRIKDGRMSFDASV